MIWRLYRLLQLIATGIAHTYYLKKWLLKWSVGIRVETNGASGVGNQLTAEDIRKAKAVIIATRTRLLVDRFDGKPLVNRRLRTVSV